MTVESRPIKIIYHANGTAREFPVPFPYSRQEDLFLTLADSGKWTETTVTNNFEVRVNQSGNTSVIYPVTGDPLPSGKILTIYRDTPETQIVDLIYGGAFAPDTIEHDGLDRIVMMIQELEEASDRSFKLPLHSEEDPDNLLDMVFQARDEACECADTSCECAEEAKRQADRAKDSADYIDGIVSGILLETGVANFRMDWKATTATPAGGILTLPGTYYPLRNVLFLSYRGAVCALRSPMLTGDMPQYEEIGTDMNVESNQVRVFFPIAPGDTISMFVWASAVGRNIEAIQAIRDESAKILEETKGVRDETKVIRDETEDLRDDVEEMIDNITIDADQIVSGVIDQSRLPSVVFERMLLVPDDTARFALTADKIQNGDSVKVIDTDIVYMVVDHNNLESESGYQKLSAGRAATVPWSGVEDKPMAFPPSSHALKHLPSGEDAIDITAFISTDEGNALKPDASGKKLFIQSGGSASAGMFREVAMFSAFSNYITKKAGIYRFICVGGGGGSGYASSTSGGSAISSGGGGGGVNITTVFLDAGTNLDVAVGKAGNGGTASAPGGTSGISSYVIDRSINASFCYGEGGKGSGTATASAGTSIGIEGIGGRSNYDRSNRSNDILSDIYFGGDSGQRAGVLDAGGGDVLSVGNGGEAGIIFTRDSVYYGRGGNGVSASNFTPTQNGNPGNGGIVIIEYAEGGMPSGMSGGNTAISFGTFEQKIPGVTGIYGEDLYILTISGMTGSSIDAQAVIGSIGSQIRVLYNIYGSVRSSNGLFVTPGRRVTGQDIAFSVKESTGDVQESHSHANCNNAPVIVTIEYSKVEGA